MSATSEFSATASRVFYCPSFSSASARAPRSAARTAALFLAECVDVALDPRDLQRRAGLRERLQPGDPAAHLRKLVLGRGRAHVRPSFWSFL
jgi:hypothetical protein